MMLDEVSANLTQGNSTDRPVGLLRRLGVLISDSLVVLGLMLLGSVLVVPLLLARLNAKAVVPSEVGWYWSSLYWAWMLIIWAGFFGFFWTRSGQTIGMRAWHIQVETDEGVLPDWPHAIKRLLCACIPWLPCLIVLVAAEHSHSIVMKHIGQGLAVISLAELLTLYADPRRRPWHERISRTRIKMLPKL